MNPELRFRDKAGRLRYRTIHRAGNGPEAIWQRSSSIQAVSAARVDMENNHGSGALTTPFTTIDAVRHVLEPRPAAGGAA